MPEESVRIMCPNLMCRRILAVPSSARGKTVRCRNCGTNIRVPMGNAHADAPDPAKQQKKSA
jgi:RNase P subunit RPR2